jgi:hypothetical protein
MNLRIRALFRAAGCRPHWQAGSPPLLAIAALRKDVPINLLTITPELRKLTL